jgi:hypothetical protein
VPTVHLDQHDQFPDNTLPWISGLTGEIRNGRLRKSKIIIEYPIKIRKKCTWLIYAQSKRHRSTHNLKKNQFTPKKPK